MRAYHDFFVDRFLHVKFLHIKRRQLFGESGCCLSDGVDLALSEDRCGGGGGRRPH